MPLTAFSTLSYTSTNKTHISFHDILEAWKRYPFRAEPPCIGHYGEYNPPLLGHQKEFVGVITRILRPEKALTLWVDTSFSQ